MRAESDEKGAKICDARVFCLVGFVGLVGVGVRESVFYLSRKSGD